MARHSVRGLCALFLPLLLLGGCSGDRKVLSEPTIDYKSPANQRNNPLATPPDLISSTGIAPDAETYSKYLLNALPQEKVVAPTLANVRYVKEGSFRWVEVQLPPHEVWPVVEKFWDDTGFALVTKSPETGIMETNWLENRSKLLGTGLTGVLDEFVGRLQDSGERDKYRTRIEAGDSPGVTEIYVSHRGLQEKQTAAGYEFDRIPNDASLEVEILRRIMLLFVEGTEEVARQIRQAEEVEEALEYGEDWLLVDADPQKAWRRASIALDRSGFTVVERDKEQAYFVIRYSDERIGDESGGGFLSGITSAFSGDTAIPAISIRIALEPNAGGGTRLSIRPHEGSEVKEVAPDIIALISENI